VSGERRVGVVAAIAFALSPFFIIQSGTYLPYVFQLLLELTFTTLLLSGRRGSRARLITAGFVAAIAFWARPFDTAIFALPFVVLVGWELRGDLRLLGARAVTVFAGASPVLVLELVANAVTTGSPLRLPFTATGRLDTFGFGPRGVFTDLTVPFTFKNGLQGLGSSVWWMPSWTFGGVILIGLALYGLWRRRDRPALRATAALAALVPLAYLAFWGAYAVTHLWRGAQTLGPFYEFPVIVPIVVLGACGIAHAYDHLPRKRSLLLVATAAMVAWTAVALPPKIDENRDVTNDYRATQRVVRDLRLQNAILFLPLRGNLGFLSPAPFLENDPSLDQSVLYAEDRAGDDFLLLDRYPGRTAAQVSLVAHRDPVHPAPAATRLTRVTGATIPLHLRIDAAQDKPVVAFLLVGRRRDAIAPSPSGDAEFVLRPDRAGRRGVAVVGAVIGRDRWEIRLPYRTTDDGAAVEVLLPGKGSRSRPPGGRRTGVSADVSSVLSLQVG
jgi:hypothetical protein